MNTFKTEILGLVKSAVPAKEPARNIAITLEYFGWDGGAGCSMQSVGEKYNLTRERVRQITHKITGLMADQSGTKLTSLTEILTVINAMAPARAERIEALLQVMGLHDERIEGVLQADRQFNKPGKHLRIVEEFGSRFVILPDMEGSAEKIMAKAQKLTSHVGLFELSDLLPLVPGIPDIAAKAYIRDVLALRSDLVWLDEAREWAWLQSSPRNRLITCLSKMLSLFASTTLNDLREGAGRYYRKGDSTPPTLSAPDAVLRNLMSSWGMATCSSAGIIRKTNDFVASIHPLEMEESIARYILGKPSKVAREKELENEMVPELNEDTHPRKYNFSIALNYSPLVRKGDKRGQYIASGIL